MVKLGSSGADVKLVQKALVAAGYPVTVDGLFGPGTEKAVKAFQVANKLDADGIVGVVTAVALHIPSQRPDPTPTPGKFADKMTSIAAAEARYGHIDWAAKHWPDQNKWIKPLVIPDGWFPGWHVEDSKVLVKSINCNIDIHGPLLAALTLIHDKGMGGLLKTYDGSLNIRPVRGSTRPSTHSYGVSLDINASENGLASTKGGFYNQPELVKCFTDQGFDWGGDWRGRKDPMHFSRAWE